MQNVVKLEALEFGRQSEDLAASFLRERGYTLLERNYHTRTGEIDIVAIKGDTISFVEVKARRNTSYGYPRETVTFSKQVRLARAAKEWLYRNNLDEAYIRFDVVEINGGKISHWQDAFDAPAEVA